MGWRKQIAQYFHNKSVGIMLTEYADLAPRPWSNRELRKFADLFSGRVIHVSGWQDKDKQGGHYRDYFSSADLYILSNIDGARGTSSESDTYLDLEAPLPADLVGQFDVVYNHTTLEHIFDIKSAFARLCELSKDIVIVVLPFAQVEHWANGSFLDYWRVTEFGLERLFSENSLQPLYISGNHNPVHPTYFFAIGSKSPEKWPQIASQGAILRAGLDRTRKFRPMAADSKVLM